MAEFKTTIKKIVVRVGRFLFLCVKKLVAALKYKKNELSALRKRRSLILQLGECIFQLAQQDVALPEETAALIWEISAADHKLNTLRAEWATRKDASTQIAEAAQDAAQPQPDPEADEQEIKVQP